MNDVGSRIKQIRKKAGLNQTAFGKMVHVSAAHISGIEKGKEKSSDRLINLIAIKFDVNEEWIKFGTGPMEPNFTQAALNTLKENRENNTIYPEVKVSMNSYYAQRYMEIVEALKPSGAIPDLIPFMDSKELISMINYLQYSYLNADERERIKLEIKFETAFPDFKDILKKLTQDQAVDSKAIIAMAQGTGKTMSFVQNKGRIVRAAEEFQTYDLENDKKNRGTSNRTARGKKLADNDK